MKTLIRLFALAIAITVIVMQCAAAPGTVRASSGQDAMLGPWNGTARVGGQELGFP